MRVLTWKFAGRRGLSLVLAGAVSLSGCAQGSFSTRDSRIGPNDGSDSCYPQAAALDSTGNFFAQDILAGAAVGALGGAVLAGLAGGDLKQIAIGSAAGAVAGGAAGYWTSLRQQSSDQAAINAQVQADLYREGTQIDRTQIAFNQLMDCRFAQAAHIRRDFAAGRIDRATAQAAMANVHARLEQNLALARQIDSQINGRADQFAFAVDSIQPGASAAVAPVSGAPPRSVMTRRAAALKLRPEPTAPDIAEIPARTSVTAEHARGNYSLVQTQGGAEGYIDVADLQGSVPPAPAPRGTRAVSVGAAAPAVSRNDDVKTLAGSNAARRDTFAESVAVSEKSGSSSFELAT